MQWRVAILFIPSVFGSVLLPILSGYKGNLSSFKNFFHLNLLSNVLVSLVVAIILVIASPYIMGLYGKEYDNNLPMIILMVSTIISAANNVSGVMLSSRGYMWAHFIINIIYSIILLFISYYLIKIGYGATGLAMAFLLSNFIYSILFYFYSIKVVLKE